MNTVTESPAPITSARATIYRMCPLGWVRSEERDVALTVQTVGYQAGVRVQGTEKGKRKAHAYRYTGSAIVVLDGWDHIAVPPPPANVGIVVFADAENDRGFSDQLAAYIQSTGAKVLVDLRKSV